MCPGEGGRGETGLRVYKRVGGDSRDSEIIAAKLRIKVNYYLNRHVLIFNINIM